MENIEFTAENGHKIKFEQTGGELMPLSIKLDTFHDYLLEKHETIALRDFLNSLDLEPKQELRQKLIKELINSAKAVLNPTTEMNRDFLISQLEKTVTKLEKILNN